MPSVFSLTPRDIGRCFVAMSERFQLGIGAIPDEVLKRPLLFDTNVWLFINGPFIDSKDSRHKVYSGLYAAALKAETPICLPQLVLGEFVGRCLRHYAASASPEKRTKIHRLKEHGDWMTDISDEVFHIVEACQKVDDDFANLDVDACFAQAIRGGIDFNDVLIAALCKQRGMILVTDDGDYAKSDAPIATTNPKLL